jgi:hypothetical protein
MTCNQSPPRLRVVWETGLPSRLTLELDRSPPAAVLTLPLGDFAERGVGMTISLWALRATSAEVRTGTVRALLNDALAGCAPILVAEYGSVRYIRDGHQRAIAHCLRGDDELRALVVRVEPS